MAQLQDRARLWRWYGVELIDIIRKIQDGLQSERPADYEKWNERLANITANDLRPLLAGLQAFDNDKPPMPAA
jgi:hypothetical protein